MTERSNPRPGLNRRDLLSSGIAAAAVAALSANAGSASAKDETKVSLQTYEGVEPQKYPWGWIRWLMNAQIDPQAEMTLGIVRVEPQQSNPMHVHPNSAEYLHVLSGACQHRVGDHWVALKAGDTLRIPRGVVHGARTQDQPLLAMLAYDTGKRQMVPVKG
jgi:quercetin dioxygenase-like cupin family protein